MPRGTKPRRPHGIDCAGLEKFDLSILPAQPLRRVVIDTRHAAIRRLTPQESVMRRDRQRTIGTISEKRRNNAIDIGSSYKGRCALNEDNNLRQCAACRFQYFQRVQ